MKNIPDSHQGYQQWFYNNITILTVVFYFLNGAIKYVSIDFTIMYVFFLMD